MPPSCPIRTPGPPRKTLARWLALEPEQLLRRCAQSPFQGPGPGGQKRNRVYSGVRLVPCQSGFSAEASERREARRNLEDALHRLRLAMALSRDLPEPLGRGYRGLWSPAPVRRRGIFPAPVSVPMPALPRRFPRAWCCGRSTPWMPAAGASPRPPPTLSCSASALTRFLAADKAVWTRTQAIRERHGLKPLKSG